MNGLDLKNHFSLERSTDVSQICDSALSSIGITYFNYIKIHADGSRELLTNNGSWIEHFYRNALYKTIGVIDIEYLLPKGYFLWSELKHDDPAYFQGRESFNIDNGISFVVKKNNETLLYIFGSTRNNYMINNFYVRNIDLFKRFILYFSDVGATLIKKAAENPIKLPEKQVIRMNSTNFLDISELKRKQFYKKTRINRYYLINQDKNLYFTRREAECVAYILDGLTAKQTARVLGISYRTVEAHFLKAKTKLECSTKEELEKIFVEANISDVILGPR